MIIARRTRRMAECLVEARLVNPAIKIGVCGEHGGDPESIHYFQSLGVDYVSCSPSRLPIAQLAAAQAGGLTCFLP
ncbi:MAG TPA: putative PEP-binding protein [Terracidiphilus sp.]